MARRIGVGVGARLGRRMGPLLSSVGTVGLLVLSAGAPGFLLLAPGPRVEGRGHGDPWVGTRARADDRLPAVDPPGADRLASGTAEPAAGRTLHRSSVIWLPGSWFRRGADEADVRYAVALCGRGRSAVLPLPCPEELFADELGAGMVWVSAFGIDRTEVTRAAYGRCVAANRCSPPRFAPPDPEGETSDHPVTGITWDEAQGYCRFVGGRLPTEAEWERAVRGHDRRRFPWGRFYNDRLANHGRAAVAASGQLTVEGDAVDGFLLTAPVGSFPAGQSPHGLLDAAGNAWEWVADLHRGPHDPEDRIDPRGAPEGSDRVVRGGSYRFPAYALRATYRASLPESTAWPDVGMRCGYNDRP